jgi:SAM-dependent methyltransferase
MQLNHWEMLAMNNPLRRFLLKEVEFKQFCQLISLLNLPIHNTKILDLACGSGYSSYLLNLTFSPEKLISFDLMPEQVKIATKANFTKNLFIGDVKLLPLHADYFDCSFGFGFLHHLSDWRSAIKEISRVTKPGGFFIFEEPNGKASEFFRKYIRFAIPRKGQFSWAELKVELKLQKFDLLAEKKIFLSCFRSFVFQKRAVS